MVEHQLNLSVLPEQLAIVRLESKSQIPYWVNSGEFFSITSTKDEVSIICPEKNVPQGITCDSGWRAIKIEGPFDLELTGVAVSVAGPISNSGIGVFIIATYDTDYVLVKEVLLNKALSALTNAGHSIIR